MPLIRDFYTWKLVKEKNFMGFKKDLFEIKLLFCKKVHTNSILVCFCSILYYKDLAVHIKRFIREKNLLKAKSMIDHHEKYYFMKNFSGKLTQIVVKSDLDQVNLDEASSSERPPKKTYKKCIVNKWHVFVKLSMNKELIQYRHHNIRSRKATSVENESQFKRILNLSMTILD
jgi:hypothetical protein